MNELQQIRDKYHNRDFIELYDADVKKAIAWVSAEEQSVSGIKLESLLKKNNNKFIKFLNLGVIVNKADNLDGNIHYYPFEFVGDHELVNSIVVWNYDAQELQTLCKVRSSTLTKKIGESGLGFDYKVSDANTSLWESHILSILDNHESKHHFNKKFPELEGVENWKKQVSEKYYKNIITSQIGIVLAVNLYLAMHQKNILISKIEQRRVYKAGEKKHKQSKRNPLYRYEVKIPENYQPRHFDVNYVVEEWSRCGHKATRWVRKENAEKLASRRGGQVLNISKGDYVKIEIPIAPQHPHRRIGNPTEKEIPKLYAT